MHPEEGARLERVTTTNGVIGYLLLVTCRSLPGMAGVASNKEQVTGNILLIADVVQLDSHPTESERGVKLQLNDNALLQPNLKS